MEKRLQSRKLAAPCVVSDWTSRGPEKLALLLDRVTKALPSPSPAEQLITPNRSVTLPRCGLLYKAALPAVASR